MINVEVIYDHKKKYKNGGSPIGPIEVRIIYQRKAYYISTGMRVHYKNFIGGSVMNQLDAPQLNERLRLIVARINEEINRCIDSNTPIDVAEIRRKAWQVSVETQPGSTPLLDWLEDHVAMLNLRSTSLAHYRSLLNRLQEYGKLRRWQDVTVDNIYRFDSWLHSLTLIAAGKVRTEKPMTDAAVYNYHKCLKAMLNRAVQVGVLESNPYHRLKGVFRRGERENVEYLTEEEIKRFVEVTPDPGTEMDVAHDLFIFQLYTGLAYSDAQAFSMADYKYVDGRYINTGERIKTGTPYISQLLPPVVEVLKKYGWKVPAISNSKYNICLKALGTIAGIEQKMHSHLARHTFATLMLRNGAPIEHVSKMLGHTDMKQTQRYAKVQAIAIHEDFDRISKMLFTKRTD